MNTREEDSTAVLALLCDILATLENPQATHFTLPAINRELFSRWLRKVLTDTPVQTVPETPYIPY